MKKSECKNWYHFNYLFLSLIFLQIGETAVILLSHDQLIELGLTALGNRVQ